MPRHSDFDLHLFTHELHALLSAGLSLAEALDALAEREQRIGKQRVVQTLLQRLREGQRLSRALAEQPAQFPDLLVASVAASEETGALAEALARFLRYRAQADRLKQTLLSAALYPALLVVVGLGVALFLLIYLVPRFARIYEGVQSDLPLGSRLLMEWGQLLAAHPLAVAMCAITVLTVVVWACLQDSVRQQLLETLWRVPAIGERLRLMQLARFYRALGLLLDGGIPLVRAMERAAPLLHASMQPALYNATRQVREGTRFSDALLDNSLSTEVALRMLRVGERNGDPGGMLEKSASFHEEEIARWITAIARLFEPILMLIIGVIIGGIVVLLYLPIFELAGSLQ